MALAPRTFYLSLQLDEIAMMPTRSWFAVFICACGLAGGADAQPVPAIDADIRQVSGPLYEVVAGSQTTVFLVTPDGIIVADPLNRPTALWLKDALASRFPNRPVRYVVYSHHHFDRAEGASAFGDPQVVAHREFNDALDAARKTLPAYVNVVDTNLNGTFDPPEISVGSDATLVLSKDRNGDGIVTPEELYQQVRAARTTYSTQLTLMLGGMSVQLVHPGPAYSRDMTVLYFPDQRVLFAANGPPVHRVPFSFDGFRPADVYQWIHAVRRLDFETLIFGNGDTMERAELVALADYLDDVRADVVDAYDRGESIGRLQARPVSTAYGSSPHASERSPQLAAVYRTVKLLKVRVGAVAAGNYDRPDASHCTAYTACAVGGAVPAITGSAAFLFLRAMGVVGELTIEQQSWNTRTREFYDEEIALRQSRGSLLLRFGPPRSSPFSYAIVGGLSVIDGDARGMTHVRSAFVPTGGRHSIHTHDKRLGYTVGVDLTIGRRFGLVVPLRLTYTPSLPQYWPSGMNFRAGAGVTAEVFRHVR
jgi:glyoxylase-like metal-dependent hydrolase (beta-lactamase superfamily II)